MKYRVDTIEHQTCKCTYIIDADCADDIIDLSYEELQEYFYNENSNDIDDYEILSIVPNDR